MKRFFAGLSLFLLFAAISTALAQTNDPNAPATREDIEHYLSVMHSHEMMTQMMDAMIKPMHQMVHEQFLKDKDKLPADFEEKTTKMMDDMLKSMPLDEMMQAMVPVYQKHLTKGDVDALIAFYSSPTGQKMLREMPAILAEAMQSSMPIMQKYMETVKQRVEDNVAEALKQSDKKTN